jgi:hypothetical protein
MTTENLAPLAPVVPKRTVAETVASIEANLKLVKSNSITAFILETLYLMLEGAAPKAD